MESDGCHIRDAVAGPRFAVRALAGLLLLLLSTGCNGRSLFRTAPAAEDLDFAKTYLALFQARAFPAIEMGMDPALKDPQIRTKVMQMASLFPQVQPTSVQLVGSSVNRSGNTTTSRLSFQYEFPGRWILADVVIERKGQAPVIKGLHIEPLKESLERINRFSLGGKSARHYTAVAVATLVMLLVVYTLVLAISSPAPSSKWAWLLAILVGVTQFSFNWTTGALSIVPMSLQLFGSGFSKPSPFEPLILTTSIPVGAIIYLIQRREWRDEPDDDTDLP